MFDKFFAKRKFHKRYTKRYVDLKHDSPTTYLYDKYEDAWVAMEYVNKGPYYELIWSTQLDHVFKEPECFADDPEDVVSEYNDGRITPIISELPIIDKQRDDNSN